MGDAQYPVQKSETEWRAVLSPQQVSSRSILSDRARHEKAGADVSSES
jgi:hypothetical protein